MVKYPDMRRMLIENIHILSDRQHQQRVWVQFDIDPNIVDNFDEVVHFFFDDTTLAEEPDALVGIILKNAEEAQVVKKVTKAIDHLLDTLGKKCPDEEYVSSPEWDAVVQAAREAKAIITDD